MLSRHEGKSLFSILLVLLLIYVFFPDSQFMSSYGRDILYTAEAYLLMMFLVSATDSDVHPLILIGTAIGIAIFFEALQLCQIESNFVLSGTFDWIDIFFAYPVGGLVALGLDTLWIRN